MDPVSIQNSIKSLAEAMFNSSSTTRSKVTFCFAVGSVNLGHILKYADEYNIMGKGFVWILASATGNVESTVADVQVMDQGHFRRLYAGVLNFDAVLLPDYIHMAIAQSGVCVCVCVHIHTHTHAHTHTRTHAHARAHTGQAICVHYICIYTSGYDMMQSNELSKWSIASVGKVAAAKGTSWQSEVYTLANAIGGGSGNHYVYDAVWANAIGLAAAMQAKDMANLHKHIRSGGGKGSFRSASGKVVFDQFGDRSFDGLTFPLLNLIPPAASDAPGFNWSTFRFSGSSTWTRIGTWEASTGFQRTPDASVLPYWPGGMRTWTPPSYAFPVPLVPLQNQPPVPSTPPAPPTIITKEVQVENAQNLLVVVLPTVLIVLSLVVCGYCIFRISTKARSDGEEEQYQQDFNRLRQRLRLTKQDGYILSTENNMWASSKSVVIQKAQMDAAVRLSRREPFDLNAFDALSVLLADNEHLRNTDRALDERQPPVPVAGFLTGALVVGSMFGSVEMSALEGKQMPLLREWILELACTILAELSVQSDVSREHSCTNVLQSDRERAEERQDISMSNLILDFETFSKGTSSEPRSKRKSGSSEGVSFRIGDRRKKLYEYFVKHVLAVRIWRDDSFALFKELKTPVQVFMNQLAEKCHERVREMNLNSDGKQLCSFFWQPDSGVQYGSMPPVHTHQNVRQDDDCIEAIRVHRGDVEEAKLEQSTPALRYAMASAGLNVDADESVFIMQLHRRGRLLDKMFKNAVIDALSKTHENAKLVALTRSFSGPSVTTSDSCFKFNSSNSCSETILGTYATPTQEAFKPEGTASIQGLVEGGIWDVESGDKALPDLSVMQDAPVGDRGDGAETWTESENVVNLKVGLFSDGPKQIEVHLAPIKSEVFCLSLSHSLYVLASTRSVSLRKCVGICVKMAQEYLRPNETSSADAQPHTQYHRNLLARTLTRMHTYSEITQDRKTKIHTWTPRVYTHGGT